MARQRDDREVQIDNSTNGRFCNAFQWLAVIAALNVGTLLVAGTVKQTVGKPLGDHETESEGKAEKAEGKVQNAIGGLKDTAREIIDRK